MKLRVRSLESKETLKLETPSPTSLQTLKDAIAEKLSIPPQTLIHLSLNRKDQIIASPTVSLISLGIASGDLIYYTTSPNGFAAAAAAAATQHQVTDVITPNEIKDNSGDTIMQTLDEPQVEIETETETETLDREDETLDGFFNLSSVPCFLHKVYKEEGLNGNFEENYKVLVIAVHAVFLESGFVCVDALTQKKIIGFCLPAGWAAKPLLNVQYTLPELLRDGGEVAETVELKIHAMGKFLYVNGSLKGKNPVGEFRLDVSRFVPAVSSVCMSEKEISAPGSSKSMNEKEVFELWKIAKDRLVLPLLISLCEETGLGPPPCFTCVPTDMKLKILEFLPGVDVGRVGCVSSELRYLSSNDELWKQKFIEEFPLLDSGEVSKDHWKEKYVTVVLREKSNRKRRLNFHPFRAPTPYLPVRRGDPRPFRFPRFPGIIGGDHDLFPAPFGSNLPHHFPGRRTFSPNCDLGGV